jgi:hypothetical protein
VYIPLILLGLLLGLGLWGKDALLSQQNHDLHVVATSLVTDKAMSFQTTPAVSWAPVQSLAAVVQINPVYDAVPSMFLRLAPLLVALVPDKSLFSLQLAPQGIIQLVEPLAPSKKAIGVNLFAIGASKVERQCGCTPPY